MIYARKTIYQDPTMSYPWKQPGMPEQAVFKIVKKSAFYQGFSPWFEYKSTPF